MVILDGGWERPSLAEDEDAPRRLFYVAMTRARRNLIVMSNDHHEYLPKQLPSVIKRTVWPDLSALPGPRRFFQSAEPRIVDLSFAGRQRQGHPVLAATGAAQTGDPLKLVFEQDRWHIKDMSDSILGRMAKNFAPPPNTKFSYGKIAAILEWRKQYGDEAFHYTLKREVWEVVIPELVFEELQC